MARVYNYTLTWSMYSVYAGSITDPRKYTKGGFFTEVNIE